MPFIFCLLAEKSELFQKTLEIDTLSYYGVALGIFSSFLLYFWQRKNEEERRKYEIRPKVVLSIEVLDYEEQAYIIKITNVGNRDLTDIHFCGDAVCALLTSKQQVKINLDCKYSDNYYNFENELQCFYMSGDKGTSPRHLSIQCTDEDGCIWSIDYNRYGYNKNIEYQQEDIYII